MEIKHLSPLEFVPGTNYSILNRGGIDGSENIIDSTFVGYGKPTVHHETLIFRNADGKESNHPFSVGPYDKLHVVDHGKPEWYVLVENHFIIGTFDTQQEAAAFREENHDLIFQLEGAYEEEVVEIVDRNHIDDIAKEFFWLQYETVDGKVIISNGGAPFSPEWIDKADDLSDYINQEA